MVQVKWALLAGLLVVFAALAGCVGGPDGEKGKPAATGTSASFGGPNETVNHAPIAKIRVSSDGLEAPVADGSAEPQAGNVTLDASGSTDPDGDTLSFSWTVDGKAQAAKTASITVPMDVGNHTANLTVADGQNLTSLDLKLIVKAKSAVGGGGGAAGGVVAKQFKGTIAAGSSNAGAASTFHPFDVPAGAQQVTASIKWDDGWTGNTPAMADIDLKVLDPKGTDLGDSAGEQFVSFEYVKISDPKKLVAGAYKIEIIPYAVSADSAYTLDVIVWMAKPTEVKFTGNKAGFNLGPGEDAVTDNTIHKQALPAGLQIVAARLTWTTGGQALPSRAGNDYDLYAFATGKEQLRSGNGVAYEFGFKVPDKGVADLGAAAEWSFEVVSFLVSSADYTLTVEYL